MFGFHFGLVCGLFATTMCANNERFYMTRVVLSDDHLNNNNDNDDNIVSSVWFRLGGPDNRFTEWFESSELIESGTGYDLSRYLDDIGMVPETLTMVKLDNNIIKIEQVVVDYNNYTFPSPRSLGVDNFDSSNSIDGDECCGCDVVTVNFFTQSHENEYYSTDCPYKQLKPLTQQNNTKSNDINTNGLINGSFNESGNRSISDSDAYVSYSDYLGAENKLMNGTIKSMKAPKQSSFRLYNATTQGVGVTDNESDKSDENNNDDNKINQDISIPTSLPAPMDSTILITNKPAQIVQKIVERVDSLPPPVEATYFSSGLMQ